MALNLGEWLKCKMKCKRDKLLILLYKQKISNKDLQFRVLHFNFLFVSLSISFPAKLRMS